MSEAPFGPPGSTAGADGTVSGSHVYADDGVYTVTICVTDDDGATTCDTLTVTVTVLEPTIEDVIAAVDPAVAAGTLVGDGPGGSAAGRLDAWRDMLGAAQNALDAGNVAGACNLLQQAYLRADGDPTPPDFVTGAARDELAQKVLILREFLGCS